MLNLTYLNCIAALDALDDICKVVDNLDFCGVTVEDDTKILDEKITTISTFLTALKENIEVKIAEDTNFNK